MKKYRIASVELINYDSFTGYKGADEFKKKFSQDHQEEGYFKFYDEKKLFQAETLLKRLNLKYKIFYGIDIDKNEISTFPVFAAGPPVEYDLIALKGKHRTLNFKKIGSQIYLMDFNSGALIISEKLKSVFESHCPHLKFEKHTNPSKKNNFYIPENINELEYPMCITQAEKIEESTAPYQGTFYPVNSDGRVSFTDKALNQIKREGLCIGKRFNYKNRIYLQAATRIFVSGPLTFELMKLMGKENSKNLLHPYPLESLF